MNKTLTTHEYFDGEILHSEGPYSITIEDNVIKSIESCDATDAQEKFAMPGLVDAHVHLFLDGGQLDFKKRSEYLKSDFDTMRATGIDNLERHLQAGVTLVRDAGDIHGINNHLRRVQENGKPRVRSPGKGMRRLDRYGSFFAEAVNSLDEIKTATEKCAKEADDIKIVLTGIIDFENGTVKGEPQFNIEELKAIQEIAKKNGCPTFVHCSGKAGLDVAVAAGVNSIEHGFFMEEYHLDIMAEKDIVWVPTFAPVCFQHDNPDHVKWSVETVENIAKILENHRKMVGYAASKGVAILPGSDAGSYGVIHGVSLTDELNSLSQAGLDTGTVLNAATAKPRLIWAEEDTRIRVGNKADIICLEASPFSDINALKHVIARY